MDFVILHSTLRSVQHSYHFPFTDSTGTIISELKKEVRQDRRQLDSKYEGYVSNLIQSGTGFEK